ncbi:MAG: hypothetical protein ACRCVA_18425 [Phreatobacter sp.]
MVSKTPRAQPNAGVRLEDRYGKVAIKAVAGALGTPKLPKAGQ